MAEVATFLPALIGGGAAIATAALTKPKMPKSEPVTRMPDENSPAVLDARRRQVAERQAADGRESTILSNDTYSNNLLGE